MPRPRYQIAEADVAVVHRWVRSKFHETAPPDHPTTEQLQQWCDRYLDAAQWKQLHAVIRAARRDASHQTRTVRLSTRASALLHDLATREQLTLSKTIERYLPTVTLTPTPQAPPPIAEQPPVQKAAARTGASKKVRSAVAAQKRCRAFVTTKKGVCYLTVKIGRDNYHLMRIYNYTMDAQDKRDMRRLHPDVDFDWKHITRQLAEKREVCRRYRSRRRTTRLSREREPFYGVFDPAERTVYVNDPTNIAGMSAMLDTTIAGRPWNGERTHALALEAWCRRCQAGSCDRRIPDCRHLYAVGASREE